MPESVLEIRHSLSGDDKLMNSIALEQQKDHQLGEQHH